MVCIYCGNPTRVSNSRLQKKANTVWRRRTCEECKATTTTTESTVLDKSVTVINKKQENQFDRDELFVSILESCRHRKTGLRDASALTDTVISSLYGEITDAAIHRDTIVVKTLECLKRFDKVSAVHYEAYHPMTKRS